MTLYFSDRFGVTTAQLAAYGALNVCLDSDLPLFIDPFLLFNSTNEEYKQLHEEIIDYLRYLRDKSVSKDMSTPDLKYFYCFPEVKQNWLGFTALGNGGRALGMDFARALHDGLHEIFRDFGEERITAGSHLEKVCLVKDGVGKDSISDFVTNLLKDYFLRYTEEFAINHIDPALLRSFRIRKARFNYETETWAERTYTLPDFNDDFVLLTPVDILTKDDTWINQTDLLADFRRIPNSLGNDELRSQIDRYFRDQLGKERTKKARDDAARRTLRQYPELLDLFIRIKEQSGGHAVDLSRKNVQEIIHIYIDLVRAAVEDIRAKTHLYDYATDSYEESLKRVRAFKHYVEHQDGYRLINNDGVGFAQESQVQLFFGLVWFGTVYDVNREPNNGRGPVDFKTSMGAADKTLIEFKLGSNTQLEKNLLHQVKIYETANATKKSIKVIVYYNEAQERRVKRIVKDLNIGDKEWLFLIDARRDNKPSASKAG